MVQPNKKKIIKKLNDVIEGKLTREEMADWSMKFIEEDELVINDFETWELLKQVGAIDLFESPENYLYSVEDIKKWISNNSE